MSGTAAIRGPVPGGASRPSARRNALQLGQIVRDGAPADSDFRVVLVECVEQGLEHHGELLDDKVDIRAGSVAGGAGCLLFWASLRALSCSV